MLYNSRFVLLHLGTVTDGEFCSLRTKGESRALHVWQLIHDARQQARNMSKKKLEGCLLAKSGIIIFVFFRTCIQVSVVQSWISPNPCQNLTHFLGSSISARLFISKLWKIELLMIRTRFLQKYLEVDKQDVGKLALTFTLTYD
jgi:hypothetical protein